MLTDRRLMIAALAGLALAGADRVEARWAAPAVRADELPAAIVESLDGSPADAAIRALAAEKRGLTSTRRKIFPRLRALVWPRRRAADTTMLLPLEALEPDPGPDGTLAVTLRLTSTAPGDLARLRRRGVVIERVDERFHLVEGRTRARSLPALASLPLVADIRPVERGRLRAGAATTEGDRAARADLVRALGYDGSGVTVGVISDGVDSLAAAQATGDLRGVTVPADARCRRGSGDEGTALLEIVHDLAPGAQLLFSEGASSNLAFIDSVNCLAAAGAQVIMDDLGFFLEPYFEDGPVAAAVRAVIQAGVSYHTAAGNEAEEHLEQFYRPSPTTSYHDFLGGPVDNTDDLSISAFDTVTCVLQWDDPFGQSANDYDLFLLDQSLTVIDSSTVTQDGAQDPIEVVGGFNPAPFAQTVKVVIQKFSGADRLLDLFCLDGVGAQYVTAAGSVFGQAAIPEVVTVGALNVSDPGLNDVESFSSHGPAEVFFPAPAVRAKPDLVAFDGVAISNAGGFPQCPPFCRLFGTSAAAPHSAATAALLLSKNPFLTPAEVRAALTSTAVDIGPTGADEATGFGRLDAFAAAAAVQGPECLADTRCDDADLCTTDACIRGTCTHTAAESFASVSCRIETVTATLDDAGPGDVAAPVRSKLGDGLHQAGLRVSTALTADHVGSHGRARKMLRTARRALGRLARLVHRARRQGRIGATLADTLRGQLASARTTLNGVLRSLTR